MLKLYYAAGTCALASHIALEEAGAPFETVRLDMQRNDQRKPDYLAVNPKGRVPALATEGGVLTETPAILAFIAQRFASANLAPSDPFAFAQLQAFNSYICSTLHVAHAHRARGHRWADDPAAIQAMKAKVPETVAEAFRHIETHAFQGPWVMGAQYTIADAYLYTVARWMEGDGVDPTQFPRVADHRHRMGQRPAVQRALATEDLAAV